MVSPVPCRFLKIESMKKALPFLALTLAFAMALHAAPADKNATGEEDAAPSGKGGNIQVAKPTRVVDYKTADGLKLTLDIYDPAGHKPSDRSPCFVAIHGGGWVHGTARSFDCFAEDFAKRGYVGISVEYRLVDKKGGGTSTVYDCVKDGRSAIRYIRKHAAELGIDPDKIAVSGGSAGGHVAAGTALFEGIDEAGEDTSVSCVPNALVLYFPVIDTSTEGYGNSKCGDRWQEISPLLRVKAGLPPTIIFHGTADKITPFKGAKAFVEAMHKAGNRCEFVVKEGGSHGFLLPAHGIEIFNSSMQKTADFLDSLGWKTSK